MLEELGGRRRGIRKRQNPICSEYCGAPPRSPPHWLSSAHGHLFSELSWEEESHHKGHATSMEPEERGETHVQRLLDRSVRYAGGTARKGHLSSLWDADTFLWLFLPLSTPSSLIPPQVLIPRQVLDKLLHANLHLRVWILRKLHLRQSLRMRTFIMDGEGSLGNKNM